MKKREKVIHNFINEQKQADRERGREEWRIKQKKKERKIVRQSWKSHEFLEFVEIIVMRNLEKENKSD